MDQIKAKSTPPTKTKLQKARVKRHPTEWGKMDGVCSSGEGLASRTCAELKPLSTRKTNNLVSNPGGEAGRQFSNEEIEMETKYTKTINVFGHRGNRNQIKRFYFSPYTITVIKKTNAKCWHRGRAESGGDIDTVGGM